MLEEFKKEMEECREIRRKMADWSFIRSQPPRIRYALEVYVETGDLYLASRLAGLSLSEMNDLRIKAKIPVVV